jgi:hypothetical protein
MFSACNNINIDLLVGERCCCLLPIAKTPNYFCFITTSPKGIRKESQKLSKALNTQQNTSYAHN